MRTWRLMVAIAAVGLIGAGCGGDDGESTEAAATVASSTSSSAPAEDSREESTEVAATVQVAETALGEVLVDGDGRTLYIFTNDSPGESSCEGGCAETWPPLVSDGEVSAGEGVDEALLGTITRADGSEQVTVADAPLYLFASDAEPGDTNGQGVGGVWFVVGADGEPIEAEAAPAAVEPSY